MSLASFQQHQGDKSPGKQRQSGAGVNLIDALESTFLDEVLETMGEEAELLSFRHRREKTSYNVKDSKNWKSARTAANSKVYGYAMGLPGRPNLR